MGNRFKTSRKESEVHGRGESIKEIIGKNVLELKRFKSPDGKEEEFTNKKLFLET